jgi:flap endonuclease-1
MGIRYLNTFLKNNCTAGINSTHLRELADHTIAVDASIYLYQYEMEGTLLSSMEILLDVMHSFTITPIFVFDGKPPVEKTDVLNDRKKQRLQAMDECNCILAKLNDDTSMCTESRDSLLAEYDKIKRNSTLVTKDKVDSVKRILDTRSIEYYDAKGEADKLCAQLVVGGTCWGCMSDDMDMFVYGCNNVIRSVDIHTQTAVVYNLQTMLHSLNISYDNFKSICILSGTDYSHSQLGARNTVGPKINLYSIMKLYGRFVKKVKFGNMSFYDWLRHYIKYDMDYEHLNHIHGMFTIQSPTSNMIAT